MIQIKAFLVTIKEDISIYLQSLVISCSESASDLKRSMVV